MDQQDTINVPLEGKSEGSKCSRNIDCLGFENNAITKGYAWNVAGRATVIASNVFMSNSLLYLASMQVGCIDETDGTVSGSDCSVKVYGFKPSSLLTNISVISYLLSVIFCPLLGAVIDYTEYRRAVGVTSSAFILVIQAVQIYTVESTWFAMAILQAIAGFWYQVLVVTNIAYLPELAQEVGEKKIVVLTPKFTMVQFSSQLAFMLLISGIGFAKPNGNNNDDKNYKNNTVWLAQVSQSICVPLLVICLGYFGWYKNMPKVKAKRDLPEGQSLWKAGVTQIVNTAIHIQRFYKHSIRWYLIALCFAEAAANSFTVCAITFLNEVIQMESAEIAVVFALVLICTIPGAKLAEIVTQKTNPNTSYKLNMVYFAIVTAIGSFVLNGRGEKKLTYVMSVFWGIALGWFYPVEKAFFAMIMPQEQATEMAGIYNFCSYVIGWVPPLIFTAMNESGISLNYGLLHLVAYFAIAIGFLSLLPSWSDIVKESRSLHDNQNDEEVSSTTMATPEKGGEKPLITED